MTIFNLNEFELKRTLNLSNKIKNVILANQGKIPFAKFMNLALYDEDYGYYNNNIDKKFNLKGDFLTAPNVNNNLFAKTLANHIKYLPYNNIIEYGSGNGNLCYDLLSILYEKITTYYIIEISDQAIIYQKKFFKEKIPQFFSKICWIKQIPIDFDGIIIANELLDAMPCNNYYFYHEKWWQKYVILNDVSLNTELGELATFVFSDFIVNENHVLEKLKKTENKIIDYNENLQSFLENLSYNIKHGYLIFIDYGAKAINRSSLRGFYKHQLIDDVLMIPGIIDITYNIDFTLIMNLALELNFMIVNYSTQAEFLINAGLIDLLTEEFNKNNTREYLQLTNQINLLIDPNEMGEQFKVLILKK